jgi:hypothetical protein
MSKEHYKEISDVTDGFLGYRVSMKIYDERMHKAFLSSTFDHNIYKYNQAECGALRCLKAIGQLAQGQSSVHRHDLATEQLRTINDPTILSNDDDLFDMPRSHLLMEGFAKLNAERLSLVAMLEREKSNEQEESIHFAQ